MTAPPLVPTPPIACTLSANEHADRTAWIAALNRSSLRSHRHDGLLLVLEYAPDAAPQIRDLVEREQQCCAFLAFHVYESAHGVRLRIEAPAEALDEAERLFAPFLTGAVAPPTGPAVAPQSGTSGEGDRGDVSSGGPEGSAGGRRSPGVAAGTAAVAALACGVCCVLPFALPAVALATVGGVLAAFARVYWWALGVAVVAVVAVAAAWLWVAWQSARTRRRPARATLRAMVIATLLLAAAVSWSGVEPLVRRALAV